MALDDDDFDDDLDDLPANALQQLEADALRSTQQQNARSHAVQRPFKPPSRAAVVKPPPSRAGPHISPPSESVESSASDYGFEDEDVIDLDAQSHLKPQGQPVQTQWGQSTSMQQFRQNQSQRSYTFHVSNKVSQPKLGYVTTTSIASTRPPSRYGAVLSSTSHQNYAQQVVDNRSTVQRGQSPPLSQMKVQRDSSGSELSHTKAQTSTAAETPPVLANIPGFQVDDLQARIAELESQNRALQTSLSEAQSTVQAKAGEAAILRSKNEKSKAEYEKRIQAIQEKNSELLNKQKSELEAARKEREKAETNTRFLENDLALEAEKARQARRTLRDATGNGRKLQNNASPLGTPRKQKLLTSHGDGFEDDVVMLSPSKYQERKRGGTPKQGTKRKRLGHEKAQNSPELALQLETAASPRQPEFQPILQLETDYEVTREFEKHKETFGVLQRLLNYRPHRTDQRTLEALAGYTLPSASGQTVSSMIYDHISTVPKAGERKPFAVYVCEFLVRLWEQCLSESYRKPLALIVDFIQFILAISPLSLSTELTPILLPPSIATVDLVAIPIAEATIAAAKRTSSALWSSSAIHSRVKFATVPYLQTKHNIDIPTDATLSLISSLAVAASISGDVMTVQTFWKNIPPDFLLVMLNKGQPLPRILLSLRLLRTSVLESSFGSVAFREDPTGTQQSKIEAGLLDRLSCLLFETSVHPIEACDKDAQQYSEDDTAQLREEVLQVFMFLCATANGTAALAAHPLLLGRLVKFLSASIAMMYSRPPPLHMLSSLVASQKGGTQPHQALLRRHPVPAINLSMRVLAHILLSTPDLRLSNKLAVIPGGAHKYMISLTRLAFAETGYILERGIEEEVIEAAHRLLEEWVSPEEGEQLVRAHSSSGSNGRDRITDFDGGEVGDAL